jgi:hypothetical protein
MFQNDMNTTTTTTAMATMAAKLLHEEANISPTKSM